MFLFVSIFLSVFHLSGFSSVFYFLFNFVCDFPQCFISFVWNFSFCLRADSNPRALEYQANFFNHCASSVPRPITLEVGDQVVVVVSMRSGQRFIKRCKAAKTVAGTGTILAK